MLLVRNQKGSILITVLVVMVSLVLLGTALAGLSIQDQRQTVRQQKNNESLYLARGGAEAVAAYLIHNPEALDDMLLKGWDEVTLDNGAKFVVEVTEDDDGTVNIESTGYSGDYSEKLTFSLEPNPTLVYPDPESYFPVFDMAVFAEGGIEIGNSAEVIGNMGTHSVLDKDVYLSNSAKVRRNNQGRYGNVQVGIGANPNRVVHLKNGSIVEGTISNLDEERSYPLPIFPAFPDLPNRGNLNVSSTEVISSSGSYDKITLNNSKKLIINVNDGEVIKLRAKEFTVGNSSEVVVNGDGAVVLYIENDFNLTNSSKFNVDSGKPDQVLLYYKGTSNKLKLHNSTVFCGSLYAKTADIDLANGGEIWGSIFTGGKDVKLSNSSQACVQVIYAPNALVTLHNSGYVLGAIVCNEFESKNSTTVEYAGDMDDIWDLIPDIDFDAEPIEKMQYIKGSWSN